MVELLNQQLFDAVAKEDVEEVEELLERGADPNYMDLLDYSVLNMSIERNNREIFDLLIEAGVDVNLKPNPPLVESCIYYCDPSFVRVLINKGANVNIQSPTKEFAPPIYNLCSCYGGIEKLKILIENGVKLNTIVFDNYTPLELYVFMGDLDIVKCLIDHGADYHFNSGNEYSLLELAQKSKDEECIEYVKGLMNPSHA